MIMKNIFLLAAMGLLISSCIGDDFVNDQVDPEIRITNSIDTLEIGTDYQFEHMYLNEVGQEVNIDPFWSSSNPDAIQINNSGLANAVALGSSEITVEYNLDGQDTEFT